MFNTDSLQGGGSGVCNEGLLTVEDIPSHGRERSLKIRIPPLGGVILKGRSRRPAESKNGTEGRT